MAEKISIQHVPSESRHGRPLAVFTLWLASNLTIADYALGSILYGLPLAWVFFIITLGNLLGGLLLGLAVSMGPKFGYPQMMISQAVFGRLGNKPFALFNWVSTVGWYTINTILGGFALQILTHISFVEAAIILSVVQALLALYGYDIIHGFEKVMAIILGLLFVGGIVFLYPAFMSKLQEYQSVSRFDPFFLAIVLAATFSYIMSWSPYGSDYSRYLHENTSELKLVMYALGGGAIASAISEVFGVMVYIIGSNPNINPIEAASSIGAPLSIIAVSAMVLGALSANALNLYTNSLSAVTFYQRAKRSIAVVLAVALGFALALVGESNFGIFYEDFLLTLDYWITPWLGIMIASYYTKSIAPDDVSSAPSIRIASLLAYAIGIIVSLPFMNLTPYGIPYEGFLSQLMGGADISYFVSFLVVLPVFVLLRSGYKVKGKN